MSSRMHFGLRVLFAIALGFSAGTAAAQSTGITSEQTEFFEKKIRPVLATRCYSCHNSKMKTALGGLRLDTRDGLRKGGDSGPSIIVGDPEQSRLIQAISYKHELRMPPTGKLPDEQIGDLTTWVRMGAPDPRVDAPAVSAAPATYDFSKGRSLWSLQPVRRPPIPTVKRSAWVNSPIDSFILARLEAQGLQPAQVAGKRDLLRRVTFDLTGLSPKPEEIDAFLKDDSADAYTRVVERLLASPHYGERQARHWLDLVRFAETNGHEYDNDKLDPWRYRDYLIRAFNEDVPYNQLVREHLAGDLLPQPRLRSDGTAKESPIGTSYFWFGEVLNSATDSEKSRADEVDNQIDVTAKAFLGLTVACARCHDHKFDPIPTADYYSLAGVFHSTDLREAIIDSPAKAARITELSSKLQAMSSEIAKLEGHRPEQPEDAALRPADKPFERFTGVTYGGWVAQGVAFGTTPTNAAADSRAAGSHVFAGTLTSPKFRTGTELYLHVRIGGTKSDPALNERGPLRFTIVADGYKGQHIVPEGKPGLVWKTLKLTFERERNVYFEIVDRSRDGYIVVDDIVFSTSAEPPENRAPANPEVTTVTLTDEQQARLVHLKAEKQRLEAEVPPSEFAMVAEDRESRNIRLHIRGNHKNLGPEVPRQFLRVIAGENQNAVTSGSGRMEIANWTASPQNPLTARVMANRVWSHLFGSGIVRSADNFGKMGEAPSHPELLDYLADEFVRNNWSIKNLYRRIVLSNTYRMSSTASELAAKLDPNNRLLQHMTVKRLEAEAIRDAILSVSESLDPALYGPSVPPYISTWQQGRGKPKSGPLDGNGRRSLYIQVRRNFMTPFFLAFDYPSPISTIGARTVSTVPSQALMMMNNEFVAQQAGRWALKVCAAQKETNERIAAMYRSAYAREATADETTRIREFVSAQGSRAETETWADVAHVLLNTAEFIYVQ